MMVRRAALFCAGLSFVFIGLPFFLSAQQAEEGATTGKTGSFIFMPIVYYSPETRWAAGVGGIWTFRPKGTAAQSRPSALSFVAYYTQNKQYMITAKPEIYLANEAYFLAGNLEVSRYPGRFYGIGGETPDANREDFTPYQVSLEAAVWRKVAPRSGIYAGLVYNFDHYAIAEFDPAGRLAAGEISGTNGGITSGLGVQCKWDDRDNVFTPRRGRQFSFSASLYHSLFGSRFNFAKIQLDLRQFFPLFKSHALALQGIVRTTMGNVPFIALPKIGGDSVMRGYYSGRYRDKTMAALQAEYRLPLVWRLGLVAFGGFGDVAPDLGHLAPGRFKFTGGGGIRFKVDPKEGAVIRFDVGFGKGVSGIYFTAGEAF